MENVGLDKLHRQLSLLARRYQLRGQEESLALGLTVSEGYALGILTEHPFLTMGQLANELSLSLAAATKIASKLCKLSFAEKNMDKIDKRIQLISSTNKGRREYSKLQLQFKAHLKNSFEAFTSKEIATIAKGLENINSAVVEWREIRIGRLENTDD